jgi:hypothetical protein
VRPLVTLIFALLISPAFAEGAACTLSDQHWLSKELPRLKAWDAIHESFRKFTPQCDDGFIAEGYTDAIVVLLSHHWSSLPELVAISKRDSNFIKFVVRHINASADPDDLKQLLSQVANQCPPENKEICVRIHSATNSAISEL